MSALRQPAEPDSPARALPDYLPARMINEYVDCPRLFYYEQVQGVFVHIYQKTRQRVRVDLDEKAMAEAEKAIAGAWAAAAATAIPPPLVDSPKCPGCSLVGLCLPDETLRLEGGEEAEPAQLELFGGPLPRKPPARESRLLVAPRVDARPLYVNTHGSRVRKSGGLLRVKDRDKVLQDVRINEICQVNLMGNIQITTQAVQELR